MKSPAQEHKEQLDRIRNAIGGKEVTPDALGEAIRQLTIITSTPGTSSQELMNAYQLRSVAYFKVGNVDKGNQDATLAAEQAEKIQLKEIEAPLKAKLKQGKEALEEAKRLLEAGGFAGEYQLELIRAKMHFRAVIDDSKGPANDAVFQAWLGIGDVDRKAECYEAAKAAYQKADEVLAQRAATSPAFNQSGDYLRQKQALDHRSKRLEKVQEPSSTEVAIKKAIGAFTSLFASSQSSSGYHPIGK